MDKEVGGIILSFVSMACSATLCGLVCVGNTCEKVAKEYNNYVMEQTTNLDQTLGQVLKNSFEDYNITGLFFEKEEDSNVMVVNLEGKKNVVFKTDKDLGSLSKAYKAAGGDKIFSDPRELVDFKEIKPNIGKTKSASANKKAEISDVLSKVQDVMENAEAQEM